MPPVWAKGRLQLCQRIDPCVLTKDLRGKRCQVGTTLLQDSRKIQLRRVNRLCIVIAKPLYVNVIRYLREHLLFIWFHLFIQTLKPIRVYILHAKTPNKTQTTCVQSSKFSFRVKRIDYKRTRKRRHSPISNNTHTYLHIHTHTLKHTYTHTYTYTHTRARPRARIYTYRYICAQPTEADHSV